MTIALAALTLGSCDEREVWYMPDSHWILKITDVSEGRRLALTFDGETLTSHDGNSDTPPFYGNEVWDYSIAEDQLEIWRTVWSGDDETVESYTMSLAFNEQNDELTLIFKPWLGQRHIYRFERR